MAPQQRSRVGAQLAPKHKRMRGKQTPPGSPAPSTPASSSPRSSVSTPCGGAVVLPVPPTPASSSESPAVAQSGTVAPVSDTPVKEAARSNAGGMLVFPVNKGLKRRRLQKKGLPEAWTAPESIAGMKTSQRQEEFRQNWRKQKYHELKQENEKLLFSDAWKLAGKMWTALPQQAKILMVAEDTLAATRGNIDGLYHSKESATVGDLKKRPWKALNLGGALMTWNGDWCLEDPEACRAFQQCPDQDTWTLRAKQLSCYGKAIYEFSKWFETRCNHLNITDWSWCCELSLKAKDSPTRIHFHAYVSFSEKPVYFGELHLWKFPGGHAPKFEPAYKNKHVAKNIGRGHYYCQAPKIGQLSSKTTYPERDCFLVEQRWVMDLWKQKKLQHYEARIKVIEARGNTDRCLREIDLVERSEREQQEALQRAQQMGLWVRSQKPFKEVPEVSAWKREIDLTQTGRKPASGRSKFLVLEGDSQKGKTMFAQGLWGMEQTLVVNCQGVAEPNLRSFNRLVHKCIVFDEIEASTVVNNKQLFQGSVNAVKLGQSVCAQHAYDVYLYGIGLILSCNKWLDVCPKKKKAKISSEEQAWLVANSVHVVVHEKLYED